MFDIKFGFTAQQLIEEGRVCNENVHCIKQWLASQDFPKLTDEQVVLFLLSCDNKQEATKKTILAHYSIKKDSPAFFNNRCIEDQNVKKIMDTVLLCVSPKRTDDGCAVVFAKLLDTYWRNFDPESSIKALFMTLDAVTHDYPPERLILIYDMEGISLMHLLKYRPSYMKVYFNYLQNALPLKLKNIHSFNTVYFIEKIMGLVKPFMNDEVAKMLVFHPIGMDMNSFYEKWVPKRLMPEDYGGDLPPLSVLRENNIDKLREMETFFEAEELQRNRICL